VTDLEDLIGERLMIRSAGRDRSDDADIRLFSATRARRASSSISPQLRAPAQLLDLLGRLETRRPAAARGHRSRGRTVSVMLGRGVTILPDNLAVGAAVRGDVAYNRVLLEARELRRLGRRPEPRACLDVADRPLQSNIGIRSYGKDPKPRRPLRPSRGCAA